MGTQFTIGEFSKITGLTVKTLRFYHEEELLIPSMIDPQTGYRYYDESLIETARVITFLRSMEFPLAAIKEILLNRDDDKRVLDVMERQRNDLAEKLAHVKQAVRSLDRFIAEEKEARAMSQSTFTIEEKTLPPALVAGVRMTGRYRDCGSGFGRIGKALGRYISGKPFLLHYDSEYKENDADFEACMPIRQAKPAEGIDIRRLPGGKCVSLLHKGPYDSLGSSYARVFKHVKDKGYRVVMPTREVYIKGPGMIFKGNPKNYLTEIQIPVEDEVNSV